MAENMKQSDMSWKNINILIPEIVNNDFFVSAKNVKTCYIYCNACSWPK